MNKISQQILGNYQGEYEGELRVTWTRNGTVTTFVKVDSLEEAHRALEGLEKMDEFDYSVRETMGGIEEWKSRQWNKLK